MKDKLMKDHASDGAAKIIGQGYIIAIAEGGPWLAQDGTVTINWAERGIWHELSDAELALARSLSPNAEKS